MVATSNLSGRPPDDVRGLVSRASACLAFAPTALLVVAIAHAYHVQTVLGRWPVAYRDSPHSVLLSVHERVLLFPLIYLVTFGVPLWLGASAMRLRTGRASKALVAREGAQIVIALGAILALAAVDRTGYVAWLLD